MKSVPYTKAEKQTIKDCYNMGFSYDAVVIFINKRYHAGEPVRTVDGIRKQVNK